MVFFIHCGSPIERKKQIQMNWTEFDIALPDGIIVYEGQNKTIPLKAWVAVVDLSKESISARVLSSSDSDRKETPLNFLENTGARLVMNGGYFLMNKNIENFSLNFPENGLKCKCDMDNETELDDSKDTVMSLENNTIEKFTNYDTSTINTTKKLGNRVYNIYDSPYDESANSYYEKKYYYPIKPLKNGFKFKGSNSDKYKNIGKYKYEKKRINKASKKKT